MPLRLILRYLIGNREAIDAVARDKSAIWYGLFFVLIAGVAREYDQESLLYRPDLFLAPLLASAPLALLYYGYLKLKHLPKGKPLGLRSFFGLFWMTAPLALLYALPVERLFDPLTALKVNTALLATVASWRVWLFARVISQTLKQPFWLILVEILWGGSIFVVLASFSLSLSLTDIMGGTVHSQETAFKAKVGETTLITTFWLGLVLFFVQFTKGKGRQRFPEQDHASPRRLAIPAALLIGAIALLAAHQPAMNRSAKLDRLISDSERVPEGLAYMAGHQREDFAPTWPLPPAKRGEPLRLYRTRLMLEHLKPEHPAWIMDEIVHYVDAYLGAEVQGYPYHRGSILPIINQLPETSEVDDRLKQHAASLQNHFQRALQYSSDANDEAIKKVEQRLARIGVIASTRERTQLFQKKYGDQESWYAWPARDALYLIRDLPPTEEADQWLIHHEETLLAALASARSEFEEAEVAAATNRLTQAGIAVPPPTDSP